MTRPSLRYFAWAVLVTSFLIPAVLYPSIPERVLVARSFFGDGAVFAGKSIFTVFRVPLIELVCAFAIVLLGRAKVRSEWAAPFGGTITILLLTAAFKSLFQSLEMVSAPEAASKYFYFTAGVVGLGIVSAAVNSRSFVKSLGRGGFDLSRPEKAGLFAALVAYVGLSILPILYYTR